MKKGTCEAPGCDRPVHAVNLCTTHISRVYKYGTYDLPVRKPKPIPVRITLDGCWRFRGKLTPQGYGRVSRGLRQYLVHRYVWAALVGDIPDDHQLHHKCRNRDCCNPAHLEVMVPVEHVARHRAEDFVPLLRAA